MFLMKYEVLTPDANNTAYLLNGGSPADVVSLDGIGIPNIKRTEQDYTNQNGAVDYGYRLDPREMTLRLFYNAISEAAEVTLRDTLYSIFQPFDDPLRLRLTRADASVRQIDCHVVGVMDLPQSERMGASLAFSVRLLAPNPIFYHPTQQVHTFTPSPASGTVTTTLTYAGGWEEYPIIKLYGALTTPSLQCTLSTLNGTTTYLIAFSGVSIPAGDVWTLDLRPGYKTITDNAGNNKLIYNGGYASNFMDFRLFQHPLKASGSNTITLIYGGKDSSAKMEVYYYNRYLGA